MSLGLIVLKFATKIDVCKLKNVSRSMCAPKKTTKTNSLMTFEVIKSLKCIKWYNKLIILTIILRGLKFGDGKTRVAIQPNVIVKPQKAMISLNKY